MKNKQSTKPIPQDKKPCKSCTTPNICKAMGAWNTCHLQNNKS